MPFPNCGRATLRVLRVFLLVAFYLADSPPFTITNVLPLGGVYPQAALLHSTTALRRFHCYYLPFELDSVLDFILLYVCCDRATVLPVTVAHFGFITRFRFAWPLQRSPIVRRHYYVDVCCQPVLHRIPFGLRYCRLPFCWFIFCCSRWCILADTPTPPAFYPQLPDYCINLLPTALILYVLIQIRLVVVLLAHCPFGRFVCCLVTIHIPHCWICCITLFFHLRFNQRCTSDSTHDFIYILDVSILSIVVVFHCWFCCYIYHSLLLLFVVRADCPLNVYSMCCIFIYLSPRTLFIIALEFVVRCRCWPVVDLLFVDFVCAHN